MKGCLATIVVFMALAGGGYAVYANPLLPDRVTQVGRDTVTWVQTEAGKVAPSSPAATATATPAPALPDPTAAPVGYAPWSAADLAWAADTLATDQRLDLAEAQAIANGSDTRYGTGPDAVAYYQRYAVKWATTLAEVQGWAAGTPITPAQREEATGWFNLAISQHMADTQSRPINGPWNDQWIANYNRLIALYAS